MLIRLPLALYSLSISLGPASAAARNVSETKQITLYTHGTTRFEPLSEKINNLRF